ncbi:MAG: class I SAM-dependent methyltransferase [Thiocapsa sp.]|uniref:class I SAM-dependent methyltransferase n=1 Tax=Thiocapsa sp. TaxID=2024551 RepID=UPI001BCE7BDF|nr:class I SAM-dependent methyltransferase [Thiocapsa sp.]QVL50132.1 MAG: class I SAM-dependent methyltransferase [Thiocapsa sp.]
MTNAIHRRFEAGRDAVRWSPDRYDRYRVPTPQSIVETALRITRERPRLVVDVGAGTGLSTRCWAPVADDVIGIEPSDAMRAEAVKRTSLPNVHFQQGLGHSTGLADACVDIVSCSSALHWMNPEFFPAEVLRILRVGGVLCAFWHRYPHAIDAWVVSRAYQAFQSEVNRFTVSHSSALRSWAWPEATKTFRANAGFRYVEELAFHVEKSWTFETFIGWVNTIGALNAPLDVDSAADPRPALLAELMRTVEPYFAGNPLIFHLTYPTLIAVR